MTLERAIVHQDSDCYIDHSSVMEEMKIKRKISCCLTKFGKRVPTLKNGHNTSSHYNDSRGLVKRT